MPIAVVILAAGMGSRMKSDLPKVLHKVAHAPLLVHAMRAAADLEPERMVIVTGHGSELVSAAASAEDDTAITVVQSEQLGTAHAVDQARSALADFDGDVLVLYGDTPFIEPDTMRAMLAKRAEGHGVIVLGFTPEDPAKYGRLILAADGTLEEIVEFKDASDAQRAVTLCNSGVICADRELMFDLIAEVNDDNAAGEYYLTDLPALARKRGLTNAAVECAEAETMGVNSRIDLAAAENVFQQRTRQHLLAEGVTMTAPETVFLAYDTIIGRDVIIEPNVVFGPDVTIESGATLRAFSHFEGCHVSNDCIVGPYARLRPGAELQNNVKVGNFVEIKNAQIDEGAKVNHLTYIGDAEIGQNANIGAGTVTCNYDGYFKHKTIIGQDAFIGSSTMLVAPVKVGHGALTASGSVITKDVPDGALAVARGIQSNKDGLALRLMNKLKAAKAALKKD